jgi:plasmid stability protein
MASITIRNLNDDLKRKLRIRAAEHGCSMEQEAREILHDALNKTVLLEKNIGIAIHEAFRPYALKEFQAPARGPMRELPKFE